MHVVLECGIEFSRVSGVSSKFIVNMQLFSLSCCASECNDIFWNATIVRVGSSGFGKCLLDTPQEHQTILTNVTLSKVSDFSFIMVIFENFFKKKFKYLKEMKKYVSKLILQDDPNYTGTFQQYIRMVLIFTDF